MTDSRNKLLYIDQRALVHAWEASGRSAYIRAKRGGGVSISLNGMRSVCVRDAMRKIENRMAAEPAMLAAFRAYPGK